ncbi:family 16 glycosylhydrolase [Agaribacterium sp. ZY112]|uniref:glycoside hydrolase family 16 protein n=1 Tax=Agaribacterium sp. ZY112 TaxID=3233574 RepID=UPI003524D925
MNLRNMFAVTAGSILLASAAFAAPPGSGWKEIPGMSDEFNDNRIATGKWHKNGFTSNNYAWPGAKLWNFTPRAKNIDEVEGKYLKISSYLEENNGKPYTSGIITSRTKVRYGYFEARMKSAPGSLNSAFWLWDIGVGNTYSHELDIQESRGTGAMWGNHFRVHLHRHQSKEIDERQSWGTDTGIPLGVKIDEGFHIYGSEWDKDKVRFYFNNYPRWTINHNWMRKQQRLRLSLGVFGQMLPDESGESMYVDWVRSWRK